MAHYWACGLVRLDTPPPFKHIGRGSRRRPLADDKSMVKSPISFSHSHLVHADCRQCELPCNGRNGMPSERLNP